MKTYFVDLIPKIQRFSQKLDNLTLLTNQHWVVIDDIDLNKYVYIFRQNNELLISVNGKVEKAKWEYLGQNTLLIDRKEESFLFRQGFFDENILALKVDSKNEYAFLVNETKFYKELNSVEAIKEFLRLKYIDGGIFRSLQEVKECRDEGQDGNEFALEKEWMIYNCAQGKLEIEIFKINKVPHDGDRAKLNNQFAPNGKYKIAFMHFIHIKNGVVEKISVL